MIRRASEAQGRDNAFSSALNVAYVSSYPPSWCWSLLFRRREVPGLKSSLSRILANYSNFSRITAELYVVQQFVYILLYMRNDEKWSFCVYGHLRENTFAFTDLKSRLLLLYE